MTTPWLQRLHLRIIDRMRGPLGSVARASGWVLLGTIVSRALSFAGSVMVARLLSPTSFGQLAVIQSTGVLAAGLISGGLAVTATHYVAIHRERSRARAIRHGAGAITLSICGGSIGALAVYLFAGPIAEHLLLDPTLRHGLALSALYILFASVSGVAVGSLYGLSEFRQTSVIAVVRAVLLVVSQVLGSVWWGMEGAVTGLVLSEGAVLVYAVALFARLGRKEGLTGSWWPDGPSSRALVSFSAPALLSSAATQPALWLTGVLLVREVDGFASMALFNVADRYRQLIVFLPSTLSPIALSYLSSLHGQGDTGGFHFILRWNVIATVSVVLPPLVFLVICAPEAMGLYGPEYIGGWVTLALLACSSLFVALNTVFGQSLVSIGHIWWRCAFDVILALVLITWGYFLVPAFASSGLAGAHLIAYAFVTIGLAVCLRWMSSHSPVAAGDGATRRIPGDS